jgi:large subunit ribosomal protein L7/L12|tara:strand:+ start:7721 stop:8116 length:396 start_codon:yes stop_codon:yes gene_type:complete
MAEKINDILEQLKSLTLLEASELVEKIEETFGVDASSGGGMMMVAGAAGGAAEGGEAAEEKTEFDLFLADVPADKKIAILKIVRTLTGLGLKEAKELVESAPKVIKEAMPKSDAEEAKAQIETAGGKVELK